MSQQLEIIKSLAAKAQAAHVYELKPVLLTLVAAMIEWMEEEETNTEYYVYGWKKEEEKNGKR